MEEKKLSTKSVMGEKKNTRSLYVIGKTLLEKMVIYIGTLTTNKEHVNRELQ